MPFSIDYTQLKAAHLGLVLASVGLFSLRGVGVLAGWRWPMRVGARRASVLIDSGLLLAGVALWWSWGAPLTGQPWLATKLLLLPVYVVLGSWALKRAPSWRAKAVCLVLAWATVGHMVAVGMSKHPLGFLKAWWA